MNITEKEVSTFRGVVKAIGVWQLLMGAHNLISIVLEKTGVSPVTASRQLSHGEHIAWAAILFAEGIILLFGTDAICHLAFGWGRLAKAKAEDERPGGS